MTRTTTLLALLLALLPCGCDMNNAAEDPSSPAVRAADERGDDPASEPRPAPHDPENDTQSSATRNDAEDDARSSQTNTSEARSSDAQSPDARSPEERLMGTWVAQDVDVSLGEVKVKLTFRREGSLKIAAWSDIPLVGQVRDKTKPFEVNGNTITSEALRGGTTAEFWFEDDHLMIQLADGKIIEFQQA